MESLPSLPVRLPAWTSHDAGELAYSGIYEHRGLLRAEGDALVLEVRPVGIEGEGDVEAHRLALADVSAVVFRSGWWRTRVELRPRHLAAFERLPGVARDVLPLRVARRDRTLASRWATEISLALLDWEAD